MPDVYLGFCRHLNQLFQNCFADIVRRVAVIYEVGGQFGRVFVVSATIILHGRVLSLNGVRIRLCRAGECFRTCQPAVLTLLLLLMDSFSCHHATREASPSKPRLLLCPLLWLLAQLLILRLTVFV